MQSSDTGDSDHAHCGDFELCFARNSGDFRYVRQFFYSDTDHSDDRWYDSTAGDWQADGWTLEDDVYRVNNHDGSCDLQVIDWNGALPSSTQTIPNNGSGWVVLSDGVRNQNNEHKRVNC